MSNVVVKLQTCYVCGYARPCLREAAGAPVCERCMRDVLHVKTDDVDVVDKAPPKSATKRVDLFKGRNVHVDAWRAGDCVVCGGPGRDAQFAHADCWDDLSYEYKDFLYGKYKEWESS